MLACMEETKRTFMTGSEGMHILAKSQVRKHWKKFKNENWKNFKKHFFFYFNFDWGH